MLSSDEQVYKIREHQKGTNDVTHISVIHGIVHLSQLVKKMNGRKV